MELVVKKICLQVKKELTSDFSTTSAATLQHILDCKICRDYYDSMKVFYENLSSALEVKVPTNLESNILANISLDKKLKSAIEVQVPKGLESRILIAQRAIDADTSNVHILKSHSKSSKTNSNNRYKWLSIAAGLVLAIGLSIGTYQLGESHGLEQHVFAHVNEDLYALDRNDNIQLAAFNKMYSMYGIKGTNQIGTIKYAGNCPVNGKTVPHFVLDFNGHSLTVAYLPGEILSMRSVNSDNFDGVVVGAEKGSFMILSSDQKLSNDMQEFVLNSIELVDI